MGHAIEATEVARSALELRGEPTDRPPAGLSAGLSVRAGVVHGGGAGPSRCDRRCPRGAPVRGPPGLLVLASRRLLLV
jgi:hypothetical protein